MRPSLAAAAQITVSTNVVRRCDDYAGKQRNELCSLCWKCRLLDPSIRAFWPPLQSHVSSDNGISRGHSLSSSSSFLSLRFEKFVLALRDSSKFVIFLLPPSSPCSASEWDGGGRPFAPGRRLLVCGDPREFRHQLQRRPPDAPSTENVPLRRPKCRPLPPSSRGRNIACSLAHCLSAFSGNSGPSPVPRPFSSSSER